MLNPAVNDSGEGFQRRIDGQHYLGDFSWGLDNKYIGWRDKCAVVEHWVSDVVDTVWQLIVWNANWVAVYSTVHVESTNKLSLCWKFKQVNLLCIGSI